MDAVFEAKIVPGDRGPYLVLTNPANGSVREIPISGELLLFISDWLEAAFFHTEGMKYWSRELG